MSIDGYTRGIPTYKGTDGKTYGHLVETKENCISDDDGVTLANKLAAIQNGTTPVGNANKLGGKGASEYALGTDGVANTANALFGGFVSGSIKDYAVTVSMQTKRYVLTDESTTDLPISGRGIVEINRRTYDRFLIYFCIENGTIYTTRYDANLGVWLEWKTLATTADLANYLPKSGGTLTDSLWFNNVGSMVRIFQNYANFHLRNYKDATNQAVFTELRIEDGKAFLGVDVNNGVGTVSKELLHTGNKPSGLYTGTGTARTIDTGAGTLGQVCFINDLNSGSSFALVSAYGSIGQRYAEFAKEAPSDIYFSNGVIHLSASSYLNVSGFTFSYYVL